LGLLISGGEAATNKLNPHDHVDPVLFSFELANKAQAPPLRGHLEAILIELHWRKSKNMKNQWSPTSRVPDKTKMKLQAKNLKA
jgi:hypothetical protein